MPKKHEEITLLGFDFGMRRIGIAIGNTITNEAKPLLTIAAQDGIPDWEEIKKIIKEWTIKELIVGMPYNLSGQFQEITFAARKFANRLHQKFKLPVHTIDERYTTKLARSKVTKKIGVDSIAACIILQSWLNQNNGYTHVT